MLIEGSLCVGAKRYKDQLCTLNFSVNIKPLFQKKKKIIEEKFSAGQIKCMSVGMWLWWTV